MDDTADLTQLDPRYKTMMRLVAAIFAAFLFVGASIAEMAILGWTGIVWVPALLVILYVVIWLPMRRFAARGCGWCAEFCSGRTRSCPSDGSSISMSTRDRSNAPFNSPR